MLKYITGFFAIALFIMACNNKDESKTTASSGNLKLPYEASYTTEFNNNVPDSSLLLVLNSYKYWENGDLTSLRSIMDDSAYFYSSGGMRFTGLTDSLMHTMQMYRDSLSSVKITMDVWLKNHSIKDSVDYVNVWYKEIDTYKTGKVDSAYFEDDNGLKKGKLLYYSSHRQELKAK